MVCFIFSLIIAFLCMSIGLNISYMYIRKTDTFGKQRNMILEIVLCLIIHILLYTTTFRNHEKFDTLPKKLENINFSSDFKFHPSLKLIFVG